MGAHAGEDAVMELHEEEARRASEADRVREEMLEGEEALGSPQGVMVLGRRHAEGLRQASKPTHSKRRRSNRARAILSPTTRHPPPP